MYRWLMLSVASFYGFDALWGVLYEARLIAPVFADTVLYFAAMTATVFLWSRYVINYLQVKNWLIKALKYAGWLYVTLAAAALILNFFAPVVFWIDSNGDYHTASLRLVVLAMQILLFLVSAVYVLLTAKGKNQSVKRHNWAIGTYGIAMTSMVILQVAFPLLPMYSVGCLLGTCILHTFVLEDLKEDRRLELEEMVRREEAHKQELGSAKQLAYRDSLTGVKNKLAYAGMEDQFDEMIRKGEQEPFAVVVCDVNELKMVNDQYGHKEGDACIQRACAKICGIFSHSPVFRVGGDEFVVLLTGEDYYRRKELMAQISALPRTPSKIRIGETLSSGMAEYRPDQHASLLSVFEEADKAMYERKQYLKAHELSRNAPPEGNPQQEYIPVIHGRKRVLIVDDQAQNREIMGGLLSDDYDVTYAEDGTDALKILRSRKKEIDLILLDLLMPKKSGREVLAEMQVDEDLMSIPVIVLTVDQDAELDCLKIGAMDFIPKPYPNIEIVKARISKCIELSEDRELIRYTERDKLTGLLNKDYFFRYVTRLDHLYSEDPIDAIACNVNKFHSVNKLYGRQFGDRVLRSMGAALRELARETGGISCREEDDTFLLYCPHQEDYERLIRGFLAKVFAGKELADKVSVRFGVFPNARQVERIEERFERAKIAADRVKNDPEQLCGFYELN